MRIVLQKIWTNSSIIFFCSSQSSIDGDAAVCATRTQDVRKVHVLMFPSVSLFRSRLKRHRMSLKITNFLQKCMSNYNNVLDIDSCTFINAARWYFLLYPAFSRSHTAETSTYWRLTRSPVTSTAADWFIMFL